MQLEPILAPYALLGVAAGFLITWLNERVAIRWKRYLFNLVMILSFSILSFVILRPVVEDTVRQKESGILDSIKAIDSVLKDPPDHQQIYERYESEIDYKVKNMTNTLLAYLVMSPLIGMVIRSRFSSDDAYTEDGDKKPNVSESKATYREKILPYDFGCTLYNSLIESKWNAYIEDLSKFKNINLSDVTAAEEIAYLKEFRFYLSSLIAGVLLSTFESNTLPSIMNGFVDSFFKATKNTLVFQSPQEVKEILHDSCNTYLPIWRDYMKDSRNTNDSIKMMQLGGVFLKKAFGREIENMDLLFISDTSFYLTPFYSFIPSAINEFLARFEVIN